MKFVEPSQFTDPDVAARKLVEIANGIDAVQDGRIYIELINGAFLGRASESAGPKIDRCEGRRPAGFASSPRV
jgi:hypothetical protein